MAESEIPEDIMEVAFHLTAGDWNQPHDVRAKKVAAAINAERERCVQAARDYLASEYMADWGSLPDTLADAIRRDNPNET